MYNVSAILTVNQTECLNFENLGYINERLHVKDITIFSSKAAYLIIMFIRCINQNWGHP